MTALPPHEKAARAHADLEQTIYALSHDLASPLMGIKGFAEILRDEAGHKLSEEENKWLQQIIENAHVMDRLFEGLLEFSRAGRAELNMLVDLNEVLQEALLLLNGAVAKTGLTVEAADLPVVPGNKYHLVSVFQNLLSNAAKYHREGVPPLVRIDCSISDGLARLTFADNGTGFDPGSVGQVFDFGRRLHGARISGDGIGLAIVKRTVERHGGTVGATTRPGSGSTFYVSLPVLPFDPPSGRSRK